MPPINDLLVKQIPWVDARGYRNPPNPERSADTINNAINAINADPSLSRTLLLAPGDIPWDINVPVSVPSDITLRFEAGTKLHIHAGVLFTIGGGIDAPITQIFEGDGTVQQGLSSNIQFVYPQWWGAKGDGTTDDRIAFEKAIRFFGVYNPPFEISGKPGSLVLTSVAAGGDTPVYWTIKSDLTVTPFVNVRFEGGAVLLVGNENVPDVTLTMNGTFEAPIDQIFKLLNKGKIKLGTRAIRDIYPQWWGANGNGQDDDTDAIQAALDAADMTSSVEDPSHPGNSSMTRTVVLLDGNYKVSQTLILRCNLEGRTTSLNRPGIIVKFTGAGACFKNMKPYTVNMRVQNIHIDLRDALPSEPAYGILCADGHVEGLFEEIRVTCNKDKEQYGIRLIGYEDPYISHDCSTNVFIKVGVADAVIGIEIGDNPPEPPYPPGFNFNGYGSINTFFGGTILRAKVACIATRGSSNQFVGGDHTARSEVNGIRDTVLLFDGAFSQANSIISTELGYLSVAGDPPVNNENAFITIGQKAGGISQVFTATTVRLLIQGNSSTPPDFVKDFSPGDNKQRWVAVRDAAAVEARLLFVRGINKLSSTLIPNPPNPPLPGPPGPFDGSIIGGGGAVDRALLFKASSLSGASGILLGTSSAPSPDQLTFPTDLPVATNSVALMAGPDGRIYFVQSISDDLYPPGTHADQLGNIDALGNLSLRGGLQFGGGKFWKSADTKPGNDVSGVVGEIRWNNTPILGDEAPNYRGYAGWIKMPDEVWHPFGKIE